MDFVSTFIVLLQFLLIVIERALCDECVQQSACSCKTSNYTIDFWELGNGPNPRFTNIPDPTKTTTTYDFQPCRPMSGTCAGIITDVAVCQKDGAYAYVAGEAGKYEFSGDAEQDSLKITYRTEVAYGNRVSVVSLKCGTSTTFKSTGEKPDLQYNFELTSHLLCPPGAGGGGGTEPSKSGLSTGSVLVIIFFVLLIVYFIAGAVFLKYRRGAQGTEIIPNLEFWKALPGLIKDGTLFVFRGCKTDTYYSQI